ncbi:Peptide methionine sulfoxide reductase MsrA [Echinococcus granulosus]|nr:Peptide methionine sulfoxide reductase MsrA [Echinococcus granulosus]
MTETHAVLATRLFPPFPEGYLSVMFGMGCFWGAERLFWMMPGVYSTQDVCTKETGHAEVVRVIYNPQLTHFNDLLKAFWESHDPTMGNRQGNDIGTQYRSVIFVSTEDQLKSALASRDVFQRALGASRPITTEIRLLTEFFYAEPYHQQYLHKNPNGYCGLRGTGITCPLAEQP